MHVSWRRRALVREEVSGGRFGCQEAVGSASHMRRPQALGRAQAAGRPGENLVLWRYTDARVLWGGREVLSPGLQGQLCLKTPLWGAQCRPATAPGSPVATGTAASLTGPVHGGGCLWALTPGRQRTVLRPAGCSLPRAGSSLCGVGPALGFSQGQGMHPFNSSLVATSEAFARSSRGGSGSRLVV